MINATALHWHRQTYIGDRRIAVELVQVALRGPVCEQDGQRDRHGACATDVLRPNTTGGLDGGHRLHRRFAHRVACAHRDGVRHLAWQSCVTGGDSRTT